MSSSMGGGPLFVCATTTVLGRAGQHETGLLSGVVDTFNQLGAAIRVAVASTVAAAGLARSPSISGFTDAFTVFTVVAAAAAILSLRLVPPGKPQITEVQEAHTDARRSELTCSPGFSGHIGSSFGVIYMTANQHEEHGMRFVLIIYQGTAPTRHGEVREHVLAP